MNSHVPLQTIGNQSNTDEAGVLTRCQAELYLCKYCSKHCKRLGQKSILYEVMDDMERSDKAAKERYEDSFTPRTLGGKLHRAFMAEVGEEMCQAEVAHHANGSPEYLCSRPEKRVHLYKKALAITLPQRDDEDADDENASAAAPRALKKRATKPSDLEMYERRMDYWFQEGSLISDVLPHKDTPEEQVAEASLWEFFRLVRFRGGQKPFLQWYDEQERPIVTMTPSVKLSINGDFPFGARWALMQYHAWTDRSHFLDMSDVDVKASFLEWLEKPWCPWLVRQQYMQDNGSRKRCGAGPLKQKAKQPGDATGATAPTDGDAEAQEAAEKSSDEAPNSETEEASMTEEEDAGRDREDTHVLSLLYKGNVAETNRREAQQSKARIFNAKHDFYRHTRCTSVAQEESSALPAGVINVNEDSSDPDDFDGEDQDVAKETEELRAAARWINQEGWDATGEGRAVSPASGKEIDLRLDWDAVRSQLREGVDATLEGTLSRSPACKKLQIFFSHQKDIPIV